MNNNKSAYVILSMVVLIIVVVLFSKFIFPTMDDDEYFVRSYTIHNNHCDFAKIPWFTVKHKKYDFIKEKGIDFCSTCFDETDSKKMKNISKMNIEDLMWRYKSHGYSKAYLMNKYKQYDFTQIEKE